MSFPQISGQEQIVQKLVSPGAVFRVQKCSEIRLRLGQTLLGEELTAFTQNPQLD